VPLIGAPMGRQTSRKKPALQLAFFISVVIFGFILGG